MKYGEERFSIWHTEFLHPAMWHDRDIDFARWLHPAMWHVALESWHAIDFAQTSTILEFYIWFWFRPHRRSWHVILHQSPKFYPNRTTLGRKKWRHVDFQLRRISAILDFRNPITGSLKSPCTISYKSSINKIALNCLVFEKIAFFCILATDRRTDGQHRCTKPLSLSRAAA